MLPVHRNLTSPHTAYIVEAEKEKLFADDVRLMRLTLKLVLRRVKLIVALFVPKKSVKADRLL